MIFNKFIANNQFINNLLLFKKKLVLIIILFEIKINK